MESVLSQESEIDQELQYLY